MPRRTKRVPLDGLARMNIRIPAVLLRQVDAVARQDGVTRSEAARRLLVERLAFPVVVL